MSSGCLVAFARPSPTLLPLLASCLFYTGCDIRLSDTETNPKPQSVTLIAGRSVTFTAANGFEGIHGPENVTINRTADGLKIHALNGDPQLILPILEGVKPGNKLTVHAQLVSPESTTFQVFYCTSAVSEFNEAHSVRKPIHKGDNDVVVEFTEPDFNGNIRLDPGMQAGDYILKLVEIRASPADSAAQANPTPMAVELVAGKSVTFASANGFEGIQEAVNATMSRTADGLKIHALNEDPQILLPTLEGVKPGNKLTVHAQLVSPGPTEFQIFYSTSAVSEFDEAHSVRKPLQKGDNDVVVEFTEANFTGKIRLDPGGLPGDYILKLIEVRSSAAP